jgi:Mg/Co/Ni transporter MgtE
VPSANRCGPHAWWAPCRPPESAGQLWPADAAPWLSVSDQERAAWLASQRAEPGLAVVDEHGHFQGLIPPHRLAGILLREHDEDLDRLGGFLASTADARTASRETVRRRLRHRMPWLAVGLAGAMASRHAG